MPIWRLAEAAALCTAAALPPARHRQQPRGHCTLMHFQQLLFGSYLSMFFILVLAHPFLKTLCNTVPKRIYHPNGVFGNVYLSARQH